MAVVVVSVIISDKHRVFAYICNICTVFNSRKKPTVLITILALTDIDSVTDKSVSVRCFTFDKWINLKWLCLDM